MGIEREQDPEGEKAPKRVEFNLRLPPKILEEIRFQANTMGISINAWVTVALTTMAQRGSRDSFRKV